MEHQTEAGDIKRYVGKVRVPGWGLRFWDEGLGSSVQVYKGSGSCGSIRASLLLRLREAEVGSGFRVQDLGLKVQGFRV